MTMRRILILLGLFSAPLAARAFDLPWTEGRASLDLVETLVFDYHDDNRDALPEARNDHYQDLRNRFNLLLTLGDYAAYTRFDTATFWNEKNPLLSDQYVLEKIGASRDGRLLRLDLGDFYATFGRGMALRIRKIDELGVDTTLLGAKARLRTDPLELTVLSGLSNPTNLDGVNEHEVVGVLDWISGLELKWRASSCATLGFHAVTMLFDLDKSVGAETLIAGLTLDLPMVLPFLNFYAELDVKGWGDFLGFHSLAGYASAQASWQNLTWLLEVKHYDDYSLVSGDTAGLSGEKLFRIEYVKPPTLEPDDTEISNNQNLTGAHTRIDHRPFGGATMLYVSFAGFLAQDLLDVGKRAIYHARAGVEQVFLATGRFQLEGGFREENPD